MRINSGKSKHIGWDVGRIDFFKKYLQGRLCHSLEQQNNPNLLKEQIFTYESDNTNFEAQVLFTGLLMYVMK